jgi:hypothetical protein
MSEMHARHAINNSDRDRLALKRDEIDRSAERAYPTRPSPVPVQPMVSPPTYGSPQRDAINSLIDKVVGDVCERIDALEKQLHALKQQVLVGGAAAKCTLQEQVEVCLRVNEEVSRLGDTIDETAQRVLRL